MSVEQILLTIIVVTLCACVALITFRFSQLISALTESVREFRPIVKNVGKIVERFVEEQKMLDSALQELGGIVKGARGIVDGIMNRVVKPLINIFSFVQVVEGFVNKFGSRKNK